MHREISKSQGIAQSKDIQDTIGTEEMSELTFLTLKTSTRNLLMESLIRTCFLQFDILSRTFLHQGSVIWFYDNVPNSVYNWLKCIPH